MPVLLLLAAGTLTAQPPANTEAKVTPLMSKALADMPGKEALVFTVEYAPADRTLSTGTTPMGLSTCWKGPS